MKGLDVDDRVGLGWGWVWGEGVGGWASVIVLVS